MADGCVMEGVGAGAIPLFCYTRRLWCQVTLGWGRSGPERAGSSPASLVPRAGTGIGFALPLVLERFLWFNQNLSRQPDRFRLDPLGYSSVLPVLGWMVPPECGESSSDLVVIRSMAPR